MDRSGGNAGNQKESVYGAQAAVLPQVMQLFADRIEIFNREICGQSGSQVYEHLNYRVKDEESMREKCRRKHLPETPESALFEIHDAIGVRIVCAFVDDIYTNVALLKQFPDVTVIEEKDYVRHAKPNGYRSLHIVVDVPVYMSQGKLFIPVEIQIRTENMHKVSEYGIAAHWKYKEKGSVAAGMTEEEAKLQWLRSIMDWQTSDSKEFVNLIKDDFNLYSGYVYVFKIGRAHV